MKRWSWAGACSTGTSHLRVQAGCDDNAACLERQAKGGGSALIAAVSDGAGSARLSRLGSRIVTQAFCRSAATFLKCGGSVATINNDLAADWVDDIRERIGYAAGLKNEGRKAFAATLVAAVVQRQATAVVHIGDGACAFRLWGEVDWKLASWPAQGEYASTTYFVTDDPHPRTVVKIVPGLVDEIALFTDGLERLALDFAAAAPFQRFFESMFSALRQRPDAGRQRRLSRDLRAFLDSSAVTDRTDDDKTLILARRLPVVSAVRSASHVRPATS